MRHFWRRWLPGLLLAGTAPLFVLAPLFFAAPRPLPQTPVPTLSPTAIATIPPPTPSPFIMPTSPPAPTPTVGLISRRFLGYVPILMYHYIREVDPDLDELGFRLSVLPERFEAQMEWLRDNGYTPLPMSALAACLRGEAPCPPRPVAITFDDGYLDHATTALPILKRFGFPATFYVVPGLIGREGYMSWRQVQLLHDSGMEIGAHTVSHADLTTLSRAEARFEIEESREILEKRLGSPVLSFSYPAGRYDEIIVRMAYAAGFSSAVTTRPGDSTLRLYELPRRRVMGGETLAGFKWYFVPPSRLTK